MYASRRFVCNGECYFSKIKIDVAVMIGALMIVNSDIYARVLFLRNFAHAKFHENNILAQWRTHSVVY